jgi:hypothetical protein
MVGHPEIKGGRDIHDGERTAGVPGTGRLQGHQVVAAH